MRKPVKQTNRKKQYIGFILLILGIFLFAETVSAAGEEQMKEVLIQNKDLFIPNDIISSAVRWIGWMLVKGLAWVAANCAELFDKCFQFIDFTRWPPMEQFINSFRPVFIALICLSIFFIGVVLIFWHEKKPKLVMNVCLAVLVVSSSTYLIDKMNTFISTDVRNAIIGSTNGEGTAGMVYDMVGSSLFDLLYLDEKVEGGLMQVTTDNRVAYSSFSEEDLGLIDINETVRPEDVKPESEELMSNRVLYRKDGEMSLKEIYNGVAWTDLLNEYYYRYKVNWFSCIMGLLSISLIYICLAYKVIRLLYEIVVQRVLAVLYSANLSNSQKALKVLDSIKDSYITMILVMVCLKIYLMAYRMVNEMGVSAFTKAMMLLFIAFSVIDGPNIIQKLTGVDAGLSSGMGKIIAGLQASRMASQILSHGHYAASRLSAGDGITGQAGAGGTGAGNAREGLAAETNASGREEGSPGEGENSQENFANQRQEQDVSQQDNQENSQADIDQDTEVSDGTEEQSAMEGSGFSDSDVAAQTEESQMEAGTFGSDQAQAAALNGMDPATGRNVDRINDSLNSMEQDLGQMGSDNKSGLGPSKPVEFGGTIFRSEWKDTLEKNTKATMPETPEKGLHRSERRKPDKSDLE